VHLSSQLHNLSSRHRNPISHGKLGRHLGPQDVRLSPHVPDVATRLDTRDAQIVDLELSGGGGGSGGVGAGTQVVDDLCQPYQASWSSRT
jgi:hypothetical protein